MSKMSELATALDEMTEVGRTLITCGENLLKAAAHVRDCFTEPITCCACSRYPRTGFILINPWTIWISRRSPSTTCAS